MYTYLYAVKFLYKENYHCVSIIINNEKKIPGNTIEKRLKRILEQVRFKNVTYFEVIEEITQEKVKGIIVKRDNYELCCFRLGVESVCGR